MPRKESEAVPEGNSPVPQQEEFGSGEPTVADVYRLFEEGLRKMDSYFDRWNRKLDEILDEMRVMGPHVTSLEQDAWQPRLAMKADGPANTKTRERRRALLRQYKRCMGMAVLPAGLIPTRCVLPASGGDCTVPPAPLCLGENALVDTRTAAPKSCLPSLEIRSPTAAGDLLPTGETSTATRTTFNKPSLRFLDQGDKLKDEFEDSGSIIRLV